MPPHLAQHAGVRHGTQGSGRGREHPKLVKQSELEALPSMDNPGYYDPPSPASSSSSFGNDEPAAQLVSNSRKKLEDDARWIRKGKMCAWGASYEEYTRKQRSRQRLQVCLEQLLPESAADAGVAPPQNILDSETRRRTRKRQRLEDKEYYLPHLGSPSPPLTTVELAPMLALPRSYFDIVTSPAMRYSLGDDSMERGLQKTSADLLEGEKGLMQALGRLRDVVRVRERDVPEGAKSAKKRSANGNHANGDGPVANGHADGEEAVTSPKTIPPLPHVSDTDNLWRVTQEVLQQQHPPPTITFTETPEGEAPVSAPHPKLTPVHRLFTCPSGITFNAVPSPLASNPNPLLADTLKYNIDLPNQQRAVDDALERIMELLADCNEYKERLEEARERVSDVARTRKQVWKIIQRRAGREIDRMEGKP